MSIRNIALGNTEEMLVLVKRIENAISSTGLPYQKLLVRDTDGNEVTVMNFEDKITAKAPFTAVVNISADDYRSSVSYKTKGSVKIESQDNFRSFLPKGHIQERDSWNELVRMSKDIRPVLRKLVGGVLMNCKDKFKEMPLSVQSYARQNGILEATLKLTKAASAMADIMQLDKDLMLAGAMLYYVGAVDLMDDACNETAADTLIGISVASHDKLTKVIFSIMMGNDEETKKLLQDGKDDIEKLNHILLSRLRGLPTATPEALALRHLDTIVTETDVIHETTKEM